MLTVSRALMTRLKLMLFDEPSLGLAPLVVEQVSKIIQDIHRKRMTILLGRERVQGAVMVAHRGDVLENGIVA